MRTEVEKRGQWDRTPRHRREAAARMRKYWANRRAQKAKTANGYTNGHELANGNGLDDLGAVALPDIESRFPIKKYDQTLFEARRIVVQRDSIGRNSAQTFWAQFPHGTSDLTFEINRRVGRILGAEKRHNRETMRADAIDLVNYATFLVVALDEVREAANGLEIM